MSAPRPKALVAMSGGVDSSVAAALLLRAGYEVVGCFMRLGSPGEAIDAPALCETEANDAAPGGPALRAGSCSARPAQRAGPPSDRSLRIHHQGCCSITDAADARLVAAELGIPLYVCNFKKDFGRVIDYFVDEYVQGRTPNPCVRCNDWLKFGKLHDYARQIGADFIASGHYARIARADAAPDPSPERQRAGPALHQSPERKRACSSSPSTPALLRAIDPAKDQSYVLFGAPRARLAEMLLPIGDLEKPRVRDLAREFGLPVFDKPDSQEICFVPDNDYARLVERRAPAAAAPGRILDESGADLGAHSGQHRFTIGQRRGVGVALGRPVYVIDKDPAANTVTLGPREMLLTASLTAREVNWLADPGDFADWRLVRAQFRAHGAAAPAECRLDQANCALEIRFREPQSAVAPGQAVVCYDADSNTQVLGGGWINSTRRP